MKILYYDCFAGISGDMNLAAMIDIGVEPEYLQSELDKLGLQHEFELKIGKQRRQGISGTRVDVVLKEVNHHHQSTGHHNHHNHEKPHGKQPDTGSAGHHHGHRNLKDIEQIINSSSLPALVKKNSLAIFHKIAEAEARVHGKGLYEVHFHEVGATDSIVDIVGAAICFHRLGVDAIWSSPIELGGGFVKCAHGLMPVPAPATVEILAGIPTTRGAVKSEATTPTGAAILAVMAKQFTSQPELLMEKSAYGVGHRDTEIPNLLRVHLAEVADVKRGYTVMPARLLQCNIDDMTAETLGLTMDLLLENGAMDLHFTPIVMKKNRPATSLSLLCSVEDEERFKRLLFQHTTTLGVKSLPLEKSELERRFERIDTPLGSVNIKKALLDGKVIRSKPELEDCRELSRIHGIPVGEVYRQVWGGMQSPDLSKG